MPDEFKPQFEAITYIVPYPSPQEDISAAYTLLKARRVATCTDPKVVAALWVGADEARSGDHKLIDPLDPLKGKGKR